MFGSTAFGNGAQSYTDKQDDIMFEEPIKWGETEIVGIACNWEKSSFLAEYYLAQRTAESKLIKGIFTNNLSLVKQGVEEGARITQPITLITSDATNRFKNFFVTEAKKYANTEIIDYLRKVFNDVCLAEYKAAHRNTGFGPSQLHVMRSEVEKIMMFDGLQPLPITEDMVERFDISIPYGDSEVIGFVKGNGLDKNIYETFIQGVLTGDLVKVQNAIKSGKIILANTIPVVTSDGIQINFDSMSEAKNSGHPVIADYLLTINEQQKQDMMKRMGFGVR